MCRMSSGAADPVAGRLRGVVRVEGPLVVGSGTRVELTPGELQVEVLQLDAERGDVLEGELLDRLELGGLALRSATLLGPQDRDHRKGAEDQHS